MDISNIIRQLRDISYILIKFNKKCKVPHVGKKNPRHMGYVLEAGRLESGFSETTLRILVDSKLNTSQQCGLATRKSNSILGCIRQSVASWSSGMILALSSTLVRPHLEDSPQFWSSQYKRDMDVLETAWQGATKMMKDWHISAVRKS
ncbi:hypothetical protein llap_8882 [Limosa lapponica baueri]|uniref:Rna-directed dna polymerase from mobile element jockey-like n=1 Tax=Limosa lapponica baueri TaxID=1758121 RepID=A0A2I0U3Y8_LIMLA|nr:hypothetical protein llap_8882 [Limosa lapponica baueri]